MGEATADAGSDSEQGAGERLPSELVGGQPMRGGRDVEVTEVGSGERDVDLIDTVIICLDLWRS